MLETALTLIDHATVAQVQAPAGIFDDVEGIGSRLLSLRMMVWAVIAFVVIIIIWARTNVWAALIALIPIGILGYALLTIQDAPALVEDTIKRDVQSRQVGR